MKPAIKKIGLAFPEREEPGFLVIGRQQAGRCPIPKGGRIDLGGVMSMRLSALAPAGTQEERPRVVLAGREEALIEQHTGLFSYDTRCIRVRTKRGLITVTGQNLVIAYFGLKDLLIRGEVAGVTMEGGGA